MRRIIINADDCGMSTIVNAQIEKAILARKISSKSHYVQVVFCKC